MNQWEMKVQCRDGEFEDVMDDETGVAKQMVSDELEGIVTSLLNDDQVVQEGLKCQ